MRAWPIVLCAALLGCNSKSKQAPSRAPADAAAPIVVDWKQCDAALVAAQTVPLTARAQVVLDGCRVCGDWKPVLAWNTPTRDGGPKREQIDATMVACNAFCTGDAKDKFMASVDKVRGTPSRMPWRELASSCKDKVSAGTDDRFMSAPYFALDRIARAATAHGAETVAHLAVLVLPLPAVTVSGEGPMLPDLPSEVSPNVGDLQITLLGGAIYVGRLPHAKLGASGVELDLGPAGYPGEPVKLRALASALRKLIGDDKTQTITLLAPHAMPARALEPVIAAASAVAPVYLGANAHESPQGWSLVGAIPIALEGGGANHLGNEGKSIVITAEMTVAQLASELANRAAQKLPRIGVTTK